MENTIFLNYSITLDTDMILNNSKTMKNGHKITRFWKQYESGLIKIGKTGNDQFENRMRFLESNGYANTNLS